MIQTELEKPFHIIIEEFERGWGSRTDEIKGFDTREEAEEFISEYNSKNTEEQVPDWYMTASRHNYK